MLIKIPLLFPLVYSESTGDQLASYASYYCSGVSIPGSLTSIQSQALDNLVGSTNYLEEALFDTTCGDLTSCFTTYRSQLIPRVILAGASIIAAIVTLLLWIVLGGCACFRCCRRTPIFCCCKERSYPGDVSRAMKTTLGIMVLLFVVGVVVDVIFAARATVTFTQGNSALLCGGFTITSESINGANWTSDGVNHTFLGSNLLSSTVESLASVVSPSSSQIVSIATTVNRTQAIDNSLNQLDAYLNLTQAMLGDTNVLKVGPYYECVVCQACCGSSSANGSLVNQLQAVISDSLSTQVEALRLSIETTLTGPGLEQTSLSVNDTQSVISDLAAKMEEEAGTGLVDQKSSIDLGLKVILIVSSVLIALVAVPLVFLILNFVFGVYNSRQDDYSSKPPPNPCLASCGWCSAIAYAFLIFFIGGVLLVIGYFEASFCEMASDTDSFIDSINFRITGNTAGGNSTVGFTQVLDSCFKTTGDGDLLSGIYVGNETARSSLDQVYGLSNEFSQVFASPLALNESLATNPVLLELVNSMTAFGAIYMINPSDILSLLQDPAFIALPPSVKQTGLGGNAICTQNLNLDLTSTIVGESILASVQAATCPVANNQSYNILSDVDYNAQSTAALGGISIVTGSCPYTVVTQTQPYANMYEWKNAVQAKNDFPCNTISSSTDPSTNITSYTQVPANCSSQADFNTYISTYLGPALLNAANAVDNATNATYTELQNTIYPLFENQILPPLNLVLNGTDCQFLGNSWRSIYGAFCYLETIGTVEIGSTFAAFGAIAWIAIVAMFIIWRHLRDNRSLWKDDYGKKTDSQHPPGAPGPARARVVRQVAVNPVQIVANTTSSPMRAQVAQQVNPVDTVPNTSPIMRAQVVQQVNPVETVPNTSPIMRAQVVQQVNPVETVSEGKQPSSIRAEVVKEVKPLGTSSQSSSRPSRRAVVVPKSPR